MRHDPVLVVAGPIRFSVMGATKKVPVEVVVRSGRKPIVLAVVVADPLNATWTLDLAPFAGSSITFRIARKRRET